MSTNSIRRPDGPPCRCWRIPTSSDNVGAGMAVDVPMGLADLAPGGRGGPETDGAGREMRFIHYKSYRTHRRTVENKIKSVSSRFSIFYDSMSSDWDLYHVPSFKKLKAEPFISVSLCFLLFAFGA